MSNFRSPPHLHRRQRRRRQEHTDRAIAVRLARGLRGSGQVGREGVEEPDGRTDRFLALHRRTPRRTRAGHHDRRRLPLLRDEPAQIHPGRHPRPRAVHAQHGHRRLDRRRRDSARRRAVRHARAVEAARPHREAARHPELRARGEQDGSRGLRPRRLRGHRVRLLDASGGPLALSDSGQRAPRRQRHHEERANAVVRWAKPARISGDGGGRAHRR